MESVLQPPTRGVVGRPDILSRLQAAVASGRIKAETGV